MVVEREQDAVSMWQEEGVRGTVKETRWQELGGRR